MRRRSVPLPGPIYAIADAERLPLDRFAEAVAEIAASGISTIQVRAKLLPDRTLWSLLERVDRRLEGWTGSLWLDDRVDLARWFEIDGVHLGQRDLPARSARSQLSPSVAIGLSTHDAEQVVAADADEAVDWIAVGPVFRTASKRRPDPVVGLELVEQARAETSRPLIAIGGIDAATIGRVLAAGADSVAVIGALDPTRLAWSCRRLVAAAGAAA